MDGNRRTHCYYLCDPDGNECVNSPPVGKVWYDTIPELIDEIQALERASRNKEQREFPADVIDLVAKAKALVQERDKLESEREIKRRRLHYSGDSATISSATAAEQTFIHSMTFYFSLTIHVVMIACQMMP